jgi:hypothetical protein
VLGLAFLLLAVTFRSIVIPLTAIAPTCYRSAPRTACSC